MEKPNHLVNEKSPYLQQHALNPVDWYPWGDEALKKSKNDGKPIFLSIGYSSCHWCHVMERESFENEETAALLNKSFIPIKVDREERPELDAYYIRAVQAMTGSAGWPLSVFLTPDLKPYYGGTYFPPEPRQGMPSFRQVLEFAARIWKEKKGEVAQTTEEVAKAIAAEGESHGSKPGASAVDDGFAEIASMFDSVHGGFGGAPKFPVPLTSMFLLRYHHRTGNELALRCVTKTLDEMMAGGIRDHVGGGFHRYSTDSVWLVPHFEKMLYDNALLARLYVEAFQVTGRQEYIGVADETLGWILKEMTDGNGGFYSAQDADTVEGEGNYYTWTPKEAEEALGEEEAGRFCAQYGVTQNGNFDGRSILHVKQTPDGQRTPVMSQRWRKKLYDVRRTRSAPATDKKELTSWNGLCISALSVAAAASDRPEYLRPARRAAEFILGTCSADGRLLRRFAGGEAKLDGTLEDYAFFIQGLLDLFEASSEPKWLREAVRLADVMVASFEDKSAGGLFLTVDAEPARLMEGYDGPTPSGNSVAILDLLRIDALVGGGSRADVAEKALTRFGAAIERQPTGHANMLAGLDLLTSGLREVVITGRTESVTDAMKGAVSRVFHPDAVVLVTTDKTYGELMEMSSLLQGRKPQADARAYVCHNFTCKLPSGSPEALLKQLTERQN